MFNYKTLLNFLVKLRNILKKDKKFVPLGKPIMGI